MKEKLKSIVRYVPYQKCPKCEGFGSIYINKLDLNSTNSAIGSFTCDVCKGAMIIPMHVLN